jgi:hypothetical protein
MSSRVPVPRDPADVMRRIAAIPGRLPSLPDKTATVPPKACRPFCCVVTSITGFRFSLAVSDWVITLRPIG